MARKSYRREVLLAPSWFNHRINQGVARYARQANWILDSTYIHMGTLPRRWRGDGVITMLPEQPQGPLVEFVKNARVPVVDLSNSCSDIVLPRVLDDNLAIGEAAAEHLLENGFRHLAFYKSYESWSQELRLDGFRRQAARGGAGFHLIDWWAACGNGTVEYDQRAWLAAELKKLPLPLGVMGINDELTTVVLYSAAAAGLAVPEQIAVVGVDDDPFAGELAPVGLTSVKSDPVQQGYRAAELLDELMNGRPAPKKPILLQPNGVIVRASSDTIAVDNEKVAAALAFIRMNYKTPILAETVAEHLAMSRRRLHDLFMEHLGRSVADELQRRRIELAIKLLRSTDDTVKEIAAKSGFSSAEHMSKAFSRTLSTPPGKFRKSRTDR